MTGNDRRSQVLGIVRHSREPLDDDQLARSCADESRLRDPALPATGGGGLVVRQRSGDGKLVNVRPLVILPLRKPAARQSAAAATPAASRAPGGTG